MKKMIFALSVLASAVAFATDSVDFSADGSELRPLLHSTCFNANVKDHNSGQEPYLTNGGFASSETILWSEGDFNQRVTDLHHIFPLVGQDPNDAANYFFKASDRKMFYAARCNLDVMYRLGSAKESAGYNAHTLVPTNFANVANVMSHIISHYRGDFADGVDYSSRISRWEIWSGPDDPDSWWAPGMTPAELKAAFAEFFVTCLRKIKTDHPEVKVGGPALSKWDPDYMGAILDACDAAGVYPDFISYQCYTNSVDGLLSQPAEIRAWLDARGANYADCEIILSAWHYLPDAAGSGTLTDLDMDSVHQASFGEGGTMTATAAAFNLAVLSGLQDTPLARAYHGASTAFSAFSPFHWSTYNTSVPHVAANAFKMFGTVTRDYTRVLSVQNDGAQSVIAVANDAGTKGALLVTDSSVAAGSVEVPLSGLASVSGLAAKVVNDSGADVQTLSSGVTLAATAATIAKAAGPQSYLLTFDMTTGDDPVDPDDPTGKTYVFVGGDSSGNSSFNGSTAGAATGWALQSAPSAVVGLSSLSPEDTFIVSDPDAMSKTLRAPGSGNPTFPGGTLKLNGGWLALPGSTQTVTVNDLVADGGGVVHYASGATMTLAGNVAVSNGGFKVYVNAGGNSRNMIVSSKVTGEGPISFLGSTSSDSLAEFIEFSGDMGGWTGTITDDPSLSSHMKQLTLKITTDSFGGTVTAFPAGTVAVKFNYDGLPEDKGVIVETTTIPAPLKTALTLYGPEVDFTAQNLPLVTFPAGTAVDPAEFTVRYAASVDGSATSFANLGTVENVDGTITLVANVSGSGKTTITDSMVTLSKTSATTDDEDHTTFPAVTVNDGTKDLESGVDYTLVWSPTSVSGAGTYTATIKGAGDYDGSVTKTYVVLIASAYYLVGQDADKTSSFVKSSTSAIGWSETEGGTVLADHHVTAGNNYIVPSGTTLRTPYDTPNDDPTNVFNGASLTLAGELNLRAATGTGRRIITIDNLIADGGMVNTKSTSNHPLELDGSIVVPEDEYLAFDLTGASDATHFRDVLITSTITGSGTIKVGLGDTDASGKYSIIDFAGDMSGFTGEIDRIDASKPNSFTFVLSSSAFGGSIKNLPDRTRDPNFVFNWAGLPAGKGVVISGEGLPPCMRYRSVFYNFPSLDTKNVALFTFQQAKGTKAAGGTFDNTKINFTNCVQYVLSGTSDAKSTAITQIQSNKAPKLNADGTMITCVEYADGSCTWFYNYDPSDQFAVVPASATALTSEEISAVRDGTYDGSYYTDGVHYYRFNGWEEILEAIGIDPATGASAVDDKEWLGGTSASAMLNVTVANVTSAPSDFVSRTGTFGNGEDGLQLIKSADKIRYTQFNLIDCNFPPDEDGSEVAFWGTQVSEQAGLRFVFDGCTFGSTDGAHSPTFMASTSDGSEQTVDFEFYDCEINRGTDGANRFLYSTDYDGTSKNPGVGDLVISNCTLDASVMARSTGKDAFGDAATLMMEDCTLSDRIAVPGWAFAYAQAGFTSGTYRDFKYADGTGVQFFVLDSATDGDPGVLLLKGDELLESGAAQTEYSYSFNDSGKIFFYAVASGRVVYLDDGAQFGTVPVDGTAYGLDAVNAQTVPVLDGTSLVKSGRPFTGWHKRIYDEETSSLDDSDETVYKAGDTVSHVFMKAVDEGGGNTCLYARQLFFVPVWGEQIPSKFYYTRAVTNSVDGSDDVVLVYTNTAVSGTLEVPYSYTARILVIGGGGAGSSGMGGSGGSAGDVVEKELTLSAGRYMITVGAGGVGTSAVSGPGANGANTTFRRQDGTGEVITVSGGAGGVEHTGSFGGDGGDGYAGKGEVHSGYNGGDGGDGYVSDITGTTLGYAAGGGGSTTVYNRGEGGTVTIGSEEVTVGGGGGYQDGNSYFSGETPRIGSGAGGGGGPGNSASGGDGGSGIVVVRLIGGAELVSKELKDPAGHDYYYDTCEHVGVSYVMNPLGLPDAAENAWWGFFANEPQDASVPLDGIVKATDVGEYLAKATPDAANGFVWELPLHELGAETAIDGTTSTTKDVPWQILGGTPEEFPEEITLRVTCEQTAGAPAKFPIVVTTNWLARAFPATCPHGIVVNETGKSAVEALLDEPDTGNGLRRTWQDYVLGGFTPGDPAGRVWIRADQTGDAATLRVRVQDFVPVADCGFTVNYRLNAKADDATDYTSGAAGASASFDATLPVSGARYFIETIFIPAGYDVSCECVPTVNTAGVVKVESSKKIEIVSSPWSGFSPDGTVAVKAEDFAKAACLSADDLLYVYDQANSNYLAWAVQEGGTWRPVKTYSLANGVATLSATDAPRTNAIPRGAGAWIERQDPTKPIYLYGQVDAASVTTPVVAGWNLVGCPFDRDFTVSDLPAPNEANQGDYGDHILVPTDGAPINCTYKNGSWGYTTNVVRMIGGKTFIQPTRITGGLRIPVGVGFWYVSGGSGSLIWDETK